MRLPGKNSKMGRIGASETKWPPTTQQSVENLEPASSISHRETSATAWKPDDHIESTPKRHMKGHEAPSTTKRG
ncbi:unnamed protein product [Linum trigynum]|uniref:Uncharacterized protein n=1 Tax=Linum trigynum TaxID=586398 RepID=A0AAV2EBC1_9ROSI